MYLRSTPRRNKDGSEVRYLQLAHNVWDPQQRRSTVQVVYNFGREDTANREALQRLVASVTRFLDPGAALAAAADGLEFTESRPLGGTWVLDALWARLGIGPAMRQLLKGRRLDESRRAGAVRPGREPGAGPVVEAGRRPLGQRGRAGHRACPRPATTPATGRWTGCWRSRTTWRGRSSTASPTCSNLEVDLLFFDTTSTYFETEEADEPVARDKNGSPVTSGDDADGRQRRPGSGPAGSPRTTATTCPRS